MLHKLCGGPPGPRGSPLDPLLALETKCLDVRDRPTRASACGPGGPPHKSGVGQFDSQRPQARLSSFRKLVKWCSEPIPVVWQGDCCPSIAAIMPIPFLRNNYAHIILVLCAAAVHSPERPLLADTTAIATTAAGGGFVNNAPATQTYLDNPHGVAVDTSGNVYIAAGSRIFRVDHATGIATAVAGGGPAVFNMQDGPALSIRIAPTD